MRLICHICIFRRLHDQIEMPTFSTYCSCYQPLRRRPISVVSSVTSPWTENTNQLFTTLSGDTAGLGRPKTNRPPLLGVRWRETIQAQLVGACVLSSDALNRLKSIFSRDAAARRRQLSSQLSDAMCDEMRQRTDCQQRASNDRRTRTG